jgi:hypothetical protein
MSAKFTEGFAHAGREHVARSPAPHVGPPVPVHTSVMPLSGTDESTLRRSRRAAEANGRFAAEADVLSDDAVRANVSEASEVGVLRERVADRRGRNIGSVAAARLQLELVFPALRDGHVRALEHLPRVA